jgi:formamidopyrimidine-DNA glycosylase
MVGCLASRSVRQTLAARTDHYFDRLRRERGPYRMLRYRHSRSIPQVGIFDPQGFWHLCSTRLPHLVSSAVPRRTPPCFPVRTLPELPDITVYVEALGARIVGEPLVAIRLGSPFLLRSVDPPLDELIGRAVRSVERLGKRIVIGLDGELFLVLHLMIAGRLHWTPRGAKPSRRASLATLEFESGTLTLTEAGTKRRASLYLERGRDALAVHDRGGLEVLSASREQFNARLHSQNHTLKRSLADPRLFSGIGNAYSDEILHRARLSPVKLTSRLTDDEVARLFEATRTTLSQWTERLRAEAGSDFPEDVTAFRDEMAVHGKFGRPCPDCGTTIQRIRYADNETNYCPRCQTEGKLLADRALSRLLKGDWPRSIDD